MKKLLALLLLSFSTLALASGGKGYLFFQSASQAELVLNKDQTYTLFLTKTPDYVSYFSNRPLEKAGVISLSRFVHLWNSKTIKKNFAEVPPNVAIAMLLDSGKRQSLIAVLTKPAYINNVLSYQIKLINKKAVTTGRIAHVDLFFDDIHWNPGGF